MRKHAVAGLALAACYFSLAAALTVFVVDGPGLNYPVINLGVVRIHQPRPVPATITRAGNKIAFSGLIEVDNLTDAVKAAAQSPDRTVTVTYSQGGRVLGAIKAAMLAKESGVRFRIEGDCYSACVVLLGVPGTCVNGTIAQHSAHDGKGNLNPQATGFMRQFYPPQLDAEFVRLHTYYKLGMTYIPPARLRELGVPACQS